MQQRGDSRHGSPACRLLPAGVRHTLPVKVQCSFMTQLLESRQLLPPGRRHSFPPIKKHCPPAHHLSAIFPSTTFLACLSCPHHAFLPFSFWLFPSLEPSPTIPAISTQVSFDSHIPQVTPLRPGQPLTLSPVQCSVIPPACQVLTGQPQAPHTHCPTLPPMSGPLTIRRALGLFCPPCL